MNKQQVWQKMLRSLMPPNHKYIKNKWVFKIKHNGMYQVCLEECWYSQVPSFDFSKNLSSVVNNITFCILCLVVIHFEHLSKIVDMKTTFLYRELEEEIYMQCPQDISNVRLHHFKKGIYRLVHTTRQYHKKADKILKNLRFTRDNDDSCLYVKKSAKVKYMQLFTQMII